MIHRPKENRNDLSMDEAFLRKIRDFILSDISREDTNIENLCLAVGYSRSQIHRKLIKLTGKPITQFIREVRLDEAKKMLEARIGTVSEVSYMVGFNSPAYFNRSYAEYFGVTPGETLKQVVSPQKETVPGKKEKDKSRIFIKAIYSSLATIIVLAGIYLLFESNKKAETSIAILPLKCHNMQPEYDYLGEVFANEIITQLHKVKGFDRIISHTSSSLYTSAGKQTAKEIGNALNANYLIEGLLEKQGEELSVNIQIIYAPEDSHIYANVFQGEWKDLYSLRAEIAKEISRKMDILLRNEEIEWIEEIPTRNFRAYEKYLLGNHSFEFREDALNEAIGYYQAAIDLDPDFADALVGLGKSYVAMVFYANWPPEKGYLKAKEAVDRALEINDRLAEAHEVLGLIRFEYEWDFSDGEKELRKAIRLNPNLASSYYHLADLLNLMGRFDESHTYAMEATRYDPLTSLYHDLAGYTYYLNGQVDSAINYLQRRIEISPEPGFPHYALGVVYLETGNYAKSLAEFKEAYISDTISMHNIMYLGVAYARNGLMKEAWDCYEKLNHLSKGSGSVSFGKAILLSELGQPDSSLYFLRKTYAERNNWIFYINISNYAFSTMRSNPEFIDLLNRINSEKYKATRKFDPITGANRRGRNLESGN